MSTGASFGWIGVDLDGTLARYDGWRGVEHVGAPVASMVALVRSWLDRGQQVRIFTARVSPQSCQLSGVPLEEVRRPIEAWCLQHLGKVIPVTHEKDMSMIELWDDRCVTVEPNTGRVLTLSKL